MDANDIITLLVGAGGVAGGFLGGKRLGSAAAVTTAVEVVQLLQVQVDTLEENLSKKDTEVDELKHRVSILEELVTQRAEVEAVHEEVKGVRSVVDKIAEKVGA